ncbi:neprilysin-2 [Diachasma alloeum]|uniref:neprilysin-2 n=1 Tax=Diachasma alloeum TaxID=454923 RepID=UPI0007384AA2|nr:neprilysin-2 [Diachasma alloeum]
MTSGTYQVAQGEENHPEGNDPPSERGNRKKIDDRYYKNCCILLLGFALLVIIVIAISWPFEGGSHRETEEAHTPNSSEQYRGSPSPVKTTTNEDVEIIFTTAPVVAKNSFRSGKYRNFPTETTAPHFSLDSESEQTTETRSTANPTPQDDIFVSSTTEESTRAPEIKTEEQSTSIRNLLFTNFITTTDRYRERSVPPTEESTNTGMRSTNERFYSTTDASDPPNSSEPPSRAKEASTTLNDEDFTSLKGLLVARYFGNDSSSTEDPSNDNWLDDLDTKVSTEGITSVENQINSESTTSTPGFRDDVTHRPMDFSTQESKHHLDHSDHREPVDEACTGKCRQKFSKMLSWMNHSADPCEDFYEFACGGLEADPEMIIIDPEARALSIIKKQMKREKQEGRQSFFYEYYESCVDYEEVGREKKRMYLDEIVNYTRLFSNSCPARVDSDDLTELIRVLFIFKRPVLFDVIPDIDESNPQKFILSIGPPLPDIVSQIFRNDSCVPRDNEEMSVDLDEMYENYKLCRNNTNELLDSLTELFNGELPLDFIKPLLSDFPSENEIREAYRSKNYTVLTLSDLEKQSTLLKWPLLLRGLTEVDVSHDTKLQVYFKDHLFRALRRIDDYGLHNFSQLCKAIVGIFGGDIYNWVRQLEFSKDWESKCLKLATSVLPNDASNLYMSSFTEDELNTIKLKVSDIFSELKQTLKSKFDEIHWVSPEGRDYLMQKLDAIQISIPEISYFEKTTGLDHKFTENLLAQREIIHMTKYSAYKILHKNPNTPEILWRHFATAFQPLPRSLHALNVILVPLGALESLKFTRKNEKYDYATLSSVGNLLAHEITSYFDVNGIQYWNGTRGSGFPILHDYNFTMINYENYINCQRDEIFQYSTEMTIPRSDQLVKLRIPPHTLNERLSDAAGVRLAHDTLDRLGLTQAKPTHWLDFNIDQLFYIAYAQTHCTKAPLTASSISLHENPQLPGRLRVYAAAMSNRRIGEVFKCAEGSQLLPAFTCGVFPYLEVPVPAAR